MRGRLTKRRIWGALLVTLALVQGGCGGGDSDGSEPTSTTTTTTSSTTTTTIGDGSVRCDVTVDPSLESASSECHAKVEFNLDSATEGVQVLALALDYPEDLLEMPDPPPDEDDEFFAGTVGCRPLYPLPLCCQENQTLDPLPLPLIENTSGVLSGAVTLLDPRFDFDGPTQPAVTCTLRCRDEAARLPTRDDFELFLGQAFRLEGDELEADVSCAVEVTPPE